MADFILVDEYAGKVSKIVVKGTRLNNDMPFIQIYDGDRLVAAAHLGGGQSFRVEFEPSQVGV